MSIESLRASLADRYTIERELGAGGMATVYLAQDLKHDRKVAIKVLRPELAAVIGAERFLSEIKTTANLQHPHILPLFDSGEVRLSHPERSDPEGSGVEGPRSFLFYVMPFVEGETLRDRLARETQLGIPDAVRITTEVGQALDYAHRHGVIHRDIKPENILLHDGRALVADFGIALAATTAGSRMTETGMSLGTPHYMSPEQAMGERDLDARSDIYALGCICYEMLTGAPPFDGPTAQSIVAKVMTERPTAPSVTRDTVPEQVEDAVMMALAKLPVDRFATAAEFVAALAGGGTARVTSSRIPRGAGTAKPSRGPLMALGVVTVVALGVAAWALTRSAESTAPRIYDVALPDSAMVSFAASASRDAYGGALRNLSISADGEFAVYAAQHGDSTSIWYRSLRDDDSHPIVGTLGGRSPRISPDGSQLGFLRGEATMLVPITGGEARQVLASYASALQEWISPTELFVVDADGNRANWIDPGSGEVRSRAVVRCAFGTWIPEVRRLACSFNRLGKVIDPETDEMWALRLAMPDGTPGSQLAGTAFRIIDGRYLVFIATDGSLRAAAYDPATHLVGRSVPMVTGVRREAVGEGQFDISANGTLVYAPGVDATIGRMVRLGPGGTPEPLAVEVGDFHRYDLSRDGRWLAASVQGPELNELRIYDLRDGQQFTWLRGEMIRHVLWDSVADTLLYAVNDSTSWAVLRGAPSSGVPAETLATFTSDPTTPDPLDLPEDRVAVAQDWGGSVVLRFDPTVVPSRFDTVLTEARFPSVSPAGNLIVYQTREGSRVMVTSFPTAGRRWQIASQGVEALWLSSTEVIFRAGVSWFVTRLDPRTGEPLGAPVFWGRDPRFSDTSGWSNRLSHDGGIIYVQGSQEISGNYLRVIPDWVAQMKVAVDEANR